MQRTNYFRPERKNLGDVKYPDAVRVELDDYIHLYVSIQWAGIKADDDVTEDIREQTRLTLENIKAIVEANGGKISDVCRVHVYVADFSQDNLRKIHEARAKFFEGGNAPTSTLVAVPGLPFKGAKVAIEAEGRRDKVVDNSG